MICASRCRRRRRRRRLKSRRCLCWRNTQQLALSARAKFRGGAQRDLIELGGAARSLARRRRLDGRRAAANGQRLRKKSAPPPLACLRCASVACVRFECRRGGEPHRPASLFRRRRRALCKMWQKMCRAPTHTERMNNATLLQRTETCVPANLAAGVRRRRPFSRVGPLHCLLRRVSSRSWRCAALVQLNAIAPLAAQRRRLASVASFFAHTKAETQAQRAEGAACSRARNLVPSPAEQCAPAQSSLEGSRGSCRRRRRSQQRQLFSSRAPLAAQVCVTGAAQLELGGGAGVYLAGAAA